ncbi:hypothetical protein PVAP13_7KG339770 [Panicum virgatum]|uniref:Uncharacterized protein n=1 Tax=Panicum virgatum TaxID=38727 RepID=A0A8T0QLP7_PANVG|nr:hypothetical protein PVAP13_7KG339770 [Panicum virgatum]
MPSAAPAKSKRAIRSERAEHHRVRTEKSAARRRHPRRPARSPIGTAEKESKQGSKRRTKRRTETVATAFLLRKWCAVYAAGYVPLSWPGPAGGARPQAGAAAGLTEPVRSPPSTANSPCRWGPSGWGPACKRVRNVRRRGENTELPPGARCCGCWGRGGGSNSR